MRQSTEPRKRKYVEGYGFLSFARKFRDKYGKKIVDYATKTGVEAAKTAPKRGIRKTAEATLDLIGNQIADKVTSAGKSKKKEKEDETNEIQEIYIPPEKRQQIVDALRLLQIQYKNEIPKNYKKF